MILFRDFVPFKTLIKTNFGVWETATDEKDFR